MGFLRLVLALSVVAAHVGGPSAFAPDVSVRLFFAISGFYMALVLDGKYPADWTGTKGFYVNRLLRLYPTYVVASLVALLAAAFGAGYYQGFFGRYADAGWLGLFAILTQTLIFGQDSLLFMGYAAGHPFPTRAFRLLPESQQGWRLALLPPAWSLSLEIAFYAIAPWITRLRTSVLIAVVVASYALRLALRGHLPVGDDPWTYRVFPFEIGTFLVGVLAYRVYRRADAARWETRAWPLVVVATIALLAESTKLPRGLFWAPLLMVAGLPLLFAVTRRSSIDRSVGELSYPLYLVHYPIFNLLLAHGTRHIVEATILASTIASLAIVRWVDVPVDAFRQRLARTVRARATPSPGEETIDTPPPIL